QGRSISIVYAKGDVEQIIPAFITSALPGWFSVLFLLTLLAAAMSTLSSQVHVAGTSIGRDVFHVRGDSRGNVSVVKLGMIITTIVAVIISWLAAPKPNQPDSHMGMVIARATAIFFGMCAAAFLPTYIGGLYSRRMTKAAAIASMIAGFVVYTFWALLVQAQTASSIKLVSLFTDKPSIIPVGNWPVVDALMIALPVSIIVAIVVSLFTKPCSEAHLQKCFGKGKQS
ncbi:MAG TPA: sodium:solute symporter family protein, partial [Planctomycetota bacterium]|nr:sodium:solute symporter family protein [Planctomycetota bacterium]